MHKILIEPIVTRRLSMKFGTPLKEPKQPKDYWHRSNSKFKKRFSKLDINLKNILVKLDSSNNLFRENSAKVRGKLLKILKEKIQKICL